MKTDKKSNTALRPKPIKVKSQVADSEIIFIFGLNHNQSLIRA
jgi:hypothetical protein